MISALRRHFTSEGLNTKSQYTNITLGLGILLVFLLVIASTIGAIQIPFQDLVTGQLSEFDQAVLFNIRFPRVLLAAIVGAALGVSGAAMQGLFRNPLADPTLIGITGGAALCVAATIVFVGPIAGYLGLYSLSFAAFAGGSVTCLIILRLSRLSGTFSVTHMLLAGIALNALTFASSGYLSFLSDDQQLRAISFWSMGSLGGALWEPVIVAMTIVIPCIIAISRKSKELNVLLLGEENATYIGIDTQRLKRTIVVCAALCVGMAVAVSGVIGFIGLVVPHLIRLMFGADHRLLIPGSALLGASLLLLADTLARTIAAPTEIPVGILTSIVGGPFFLWLLIRQSKGGI